MEVLGSALKHGVDPDDIDHALHHAVVIEEVGEDPSAISCSVPTAARTCSNLLYLIAQPDQQ